MKRKVKDLLKNYITVQWLKRSPVLGIWQNQWAFSSMENCHFDSNSRYLFQYVYDHMPEIVPVYVMNDPVKRKRLRKEYPRARIVDTNTREGISTVLESGVWFTSAGMPVYGTGLLKGRVIVNLWHGVPLKKIVLAEKNHHFWYRLYISLLFSKNYTWVVTTSRRMVPIMRKSFGIGKDQVKVWGQPRNDRLFACREAKEVLGGIYGDLPEFTRAVLYAPTHRDGSPVKLFPFRDFQPEELAQFLEREKLLLCVRTHMYETQQAKLPQSPRLRWLGEDLAEDVMEVLDVFDLLITDYSSIYIDFLLTGRPLMFLPYDQEEYLALRGFNFPYEKITPGPRPENFAQFCAQMKELLGGDDRYSEKRKKTDRFFNEVHEPCCELICARVQEYLKGTDV